MRKLLWGVVLCLCAAPLSAAGLDEARTLLEQRKFAEAKTLLERTAADPALRGESLVLLTRACNALEDWENGVKYGKEAAELRPEDSGAHFEYAQALRIKMTKISKIKAMMSLSNYKKELARSLELDPKNLDARDEQLAFLSNAPGFAGGDMKEARQKATELVALDWHRGKNWLANIELKNQKDEAAVPILREVVGRYPDDVQAHLRLAHTLQKLEHWQEADAEFAKLAEHAESRVALHARYQRARTRILGKYEQQAAIDMLNAYLADLPQETQGLPPAAGAWRRIGNAHAQLGHTEEARKAFEKSLSLEDSEDTRKDLAALSPRR